MLFYTGNRLRETLKLEWSWVDREKDYLVLPSSVTKNKREHLVPLVPQALRLLAMLKELSGDSVHVFPGPTGNAMSWVQKSATGSWIRLESRMGATTTHGASCRPAWPRWVSCPMWLT
jgi:integrase